VWQGVYEELKDLGFVVITVALDMDAEASRPWIEAARPTHPSLVDPRHVVADLFNMVNVPTVVWIDERGRIARPNDVAFGTDTFRHITGSRRPVTSASCAPGCAGKRPHSARRKRGRA
jgi:hypothetical protein